MSDKVNGGSSAANWDSAAKPLPVIFNKQQLEALKNILESGACNDDQACCIKKALNSDNKLSTSEVDTLKNVLNEVKHGVSEAAKSSTGSGDSSVAHAVKGGKAEAMAHLFEEDTIFAPPPGKLEYRQVEKAEKLVDSMLTTEDKGKFADQLKSFFDTVEGMDDKHLLMLAESIGNKMAKTDVNDALLGSLLKHVLNQLQDNGEVLHKILKPKMPEPLKPMFPGLPQFPEIDPGFIKKFPTIDIDPGIFKKLPAGPDIDPGIFKKLPKGPEIDPGIYDLPKKPKGIEYV